MFLSTENPPRDPLSSSSSSNLNLLRLTTTSSSSHELAQSHLSNFSIRDYAYSNRKNNIKNSWPFSTKSLHLCSSHGVTDPLPPFQKFETAPSSSSGKQIVSHVHQTIAETSKGVCSQSRIIKNGVFTSTSKSKVEIVVAATSNNKSKRCGRGMVKSKEDSSCVGLVTTTASESVMASKTCPICKTFSSASNTTLNAHIDQCLSMDSAMPPVSSKPNKPKVKPVDSAVPLVSSKPSKPKVRPVDSAVQPVSSKPSKPIMYVDSVASLVSSKPSKPRVKTQVKIKTLVDIYATAKRCTLEDLDKRNGTKWASVLSSTNRVTADKSEVSKKRKASPVGVGPVYIDAKGQKLRILTEFSEKKTSTITTTLREQQTEAISSKEKSKSLKKRRRGKKDCKYTKLTSHKANTSEKVHEYQRGLSGEGSSKGPRRIFNQRMLSKRGLVSKKLNEKGHQLYALRDQPSEDDDEGDDGSWSGEDRLVLRGADLSATGSSPLNKQKLQSQVYRTKTMFESKGAQSRSSKVHMSEKEKKSLAGASFNTVHSKKTRALVQEDKYPPGKNTDASPRATSMRNLSPPFVSNGWKLKRARFDLSDEEEEEEEEEETGKWESEMTQERELSDDDYVSGDNNPSFSRYDDYEDDDDDEESSDDEEEEDDSNSRVNVLDKSNDATPSNETIPSERAMYYSEEVVGDMIYGQTACDEEDVRFGSEVRGKGSLFVEVDTIPIPGPPGSFLPSPRGMGFDENLGNSSVVTSQFHSSMDQLDRNSSESPVSAVSNFAAGRLNFQAELPSSLDIPSSYSATPMSFCVPYHHGTIPEAEPMSVDKETPSGFRNNGYEPCCCQRKDRISEGITLNHEASHLLQRRAASSSIAMNLTESAPRLDPNHPFEQSAYMIQQEFGLHSKFSSSAVVPPSPSNSVLRLMGKDLMVMNQGEADNNEDASRISVKRDPPFHDPQPCAGTGLYFNTGLYLRNSFESTHQPQTSKAQQQTHTQTQASPFRNNFDNVRYFSPS